MNEPTILDYVKAILMPWRGPPPKIPPIEGGESPGSDSGVQDFSEASSVRSPVASVPATTLEAGVSLTDTVSQPVIRQGAEASELKTQVRLWPWSSGLAVILALLAQLALEPPDRSVRAALIFYSLATVSLILAYIRKDWVIASIERTLDRFAILTLRLPFLIVCLVSGALAFITFAGNLFTTLNVTLWLICLLTGVAACWEGLPAFRTWPGKIGAWMHKEEWRLRISPWLLALIGVSVLAIFFRLYHLNQVPPEMFSDHAEKLLDVGDVLNGQYSIFFPRNTGREAVQMYLTAAMALIFNTGLSFTSLKLGTTLAGLATLPFIYLLGKEIANRRVGLFAVALAGIAYWPNVISRVALRFTLYPFFAAPTLYFLIRGLRRARRNDLILAGLFLGLGLHGYSPFRFMPIVVVAIFVIYILHPQSEGNRKQAFLNLFVLAGISFLVFLPLFRYSIDDPEMFFYRTLTRMGSTEQAFSAPVWKIFLSNLWNASVMFFWSDGETWVHSVTFRPALDVVSAALLWLGLLSTLIRYLRDRSWVDISLMIIIPLLMMPSILSLAFPNENPSLNRTGGALIPVFIIVGLALDAFLKGLESRLPTGLGTKVAWGAGLFLLVWSASLNYDLVFRQYFSQFQAGAWNTSEIGHVIRAFADSVGDRDRAWVVPNPYWVDTRLVGINAGYPEKDYALWPENFAESLDVSAPKLFIVRPSDQNAVDLLYQIYPNGILTEYQSKIDDKNFLEFFVPY
jgi:Dolichyl-phosphate-mannose-protein mannosyltransferase